MPSFASRDDAYTRGVRLEPPRDLTIPLPGSTTARDVLSRALGRLLEDLRSLAAKDEVIAKVVRETDRGALASVVRRPNVGALVRCLRTNRTDALVRELRATLCVELSLLGALPQSVRLEGPSARVVSLVARKVVQFPSLVQDERDDFHPIDDDLLLALVDDNPLAMNEAHPDKAGNAIDLGGKSIDEWTNVIRESLARIEKHLPELREEMRLFVQQIVPVGYDAEKHLSASYREAIGTIYMTLHPSAMTMTEALIHELSHNKINALFEIDDVLENAFTPLFRSPVRPDPRPLHGVLLAVHAFLPVARLYEKMIEADAPESRSSSFRDRYREIVALNEEGAQVVLDHGKPTKMGAGLLDEIARWRSHYAR